MPVYKDKKRKTWYCQFSYMDWKGKCHQKRKRGFKREKDAKEWEAAFKAKQIKTSDIPMPELINNYMEDMSTRLKPTTMATKEHLINTKILPVFEKFRACDITPLDIRRWHNELITYKTKQGEPYSDTYLRTIHNQMSALMNYGVVFYNLAQNPCVASGNIGSSDAETMKIWTLDEYEHFVSYEKKSATKVAFDIFFWTGCREGELLALTPSDFWREGNDCIMNIDKNYQVVNGVEYFLTPKQPSSIRKLVIPEFLYKEVKEYICLLYECAPDERIFYFRKDHLLNEMKKVSAIAGVEPIRIHDLRHSHASLLIEMGFNILMVSKRLGHKNVQTTWRTYAHLYPDKDSMLASQLSNVKVQGLTGNVSVEVQLLDLLKQFQERQGESPALLDISSEEQIICWDPDRKEKTFVSKEELEAVAELNEDIEGDCAVAEIIRAGYIEICGRVYCLASRGLPIEYL